MIPSLWEQFGVGPFLFQSDFAPVHKAMSIKVRLSKYDVEELDWPAQNLYLNPNKHLWDELEAAKPYQHQCVASQYSSG